MNGGTVMIMPKFSPQEVFRIAKEQGATIFAGVPTMYNYLLQASGQNGEDLSDIRFCISGGASMPVSLLKQFEAAFDVTVSEGYGLSEASPVTCFNPLDRPRKPGSIGTSIMNVENKVVDEFGEEVPPGEVGELVVRGPNVMKGYYKLEEETAAALKMAGCIPGTWPGWTMKAIFTSWIGKRHDSCRWLQCLSARSGRSSL